MLRVLVIGEPEKKAVKEVFQYAMKPENYYRPGPNALPPGRNPNLTLQLWDFRCVFSITDTPKNGLYKHLSISVESRDKLPNVAIVEEVAHLFGIEGSVRDWAKKGHVNTNEKDNCIVVVAEYKP